MVGLLEFLLPKLDDEFVIDIRPDHEMHGDAARTYPDRKLIEISDSTYDGASNGVGRDNFTLAHEFGHLMMHSGIGPSFGRLRLKTEPAYVDAEWQADTFAAEFLMPASELIGSRLSVSQIEDKYQVSNMAARIRADQLGIRNGE
jgi:Zn-dependent peptidase ImmA (M78 family)